MLQVNTNDENSAEYWNEIYLKEYNTDKKRIDPERMNYIKGAVQRWISTNKGANPLFADFGCGNGELIRWLHYELPQFEKVGLDISSSAIEQANRDSRKVLYRIGDLNENVSDISQRSVDVAFFGETLEHLKSPEKSLELVFNTLKTGGYLILSVPCKNNNPTSEHNFTFDVWDIMKIASKYGSLEHLDVVANGLSLICIVKKEIK